MVTDDGRPVGPKVRVRARRSGSHWDPATQVLADVAADGTFTIPVPEPDQGWLVDVIADFLSVPRAIRARVEAQADTIHELLDTPSADNLKQLVRILHGDELQLGDAA